METASASAAGKGKSVERSGAYEDVLPPAVVPPEVQPVLPKVGRDRPVRLDVHVVRVARAWMPCGAHAQCEELVQRYVVCELSEE